MSEDAAAARAVAYLCDVDVDDLADEVVDEVVDLFGLDDRALRMAVAAGGRVGPLVRRMLVEAVQRTVTEVVAGAAAAAGEVGPPAVGEMASVTSLPVGEVR